ncbi:hypothetical protein HV042_16190 [Klebsiella grimontii]|uniref:hypothetical protein n=2 Tax=Klebsiella grimontii TaxID=2058152 RepID=UPI0015E4DA22|nr:hypothetical protein [Klebsiella grimontii]QLP08502.1 hypothetical protein HV042_16190 [Klebsiella grimontii]
MSFYLTGNPVPSASMPDVHDNAQNLDFALNEITSTFWTDRLGRRRMSWLGIESAFTMKLTDFESRFDFRLAEQESVFAESLVDKENRFQQFLGDSGYVFLGDYEDGPFQFSARNQYIRFQNQFYRLNKSTDTGFTTTGTDETSFANDVTHLVLMDGDTLRQNLGSGDGLKWVGGLGYTNPQKHGAISNNSLVDNTAAVMNAITESVLTGVGLDLRGGPWRINQTVDLTLVKNIITDYSGRFLINPATFIAKHDRKFVVTFGNPDTDFRSDRATHTTMLGNMVVISDDRSAELSGIYIKGALGCFGAFRVVNFNGGGFRADAWWDSVCLSISAELCGNLTQFAIDINPSGDTSNCLNIGRLQCERAFHKQINANIIRSTLGPIHAERLKILTLDDGTTGLKSGLTYLNTSIVLSNCTVDQLILDAATDAEAGTVSTTPSVRLNLYESKAQSLHLATSVVTSTYGERGSIDNSAFYKYYNPGYSVSLNACRMTRTTGDGLLQVGGAGVVASNCTIDTFQPESGTTRILLSACTINNDYSNPKDNVSGVIFNSCTLNGDIGETGPTEAAEPTLFHQCKVKGTVRGYFQNKFIMEGGHAEAVELVSRSYACLINVRGGTFSHAETGDLGYITRGCAFSSVTRWGPPRFGNYKAGERTHRMGEMGSGSVIEYVNTAAGAATFVAAITLP